MIILQSISSNTHTLILEKSNPHRYSSYSYHIIHNLKWSNSNQ